MHDHVSRLAIANKNFLGKPPYMCAMMSWFLKCIESMYNLTSIMCMTLSLCSYHVSLGYCFYLNPCSRLVYS